MADDDFGDYPKARGSLGAGDLIDVTNYTLTFEDGEKIVATIRQNPAGTTFGTRSGTADIESAISTAGFERDYLGKYFRREKVEFRLKLPGITFVCVGRFTKPNITSSVDDFIKFKISILGKITTVAA
jgi:hypothetical protein